MAYNKNSLFCHNQQQIYMIQRTCMIQLRIQMKYDGKKLSWDLVWYWQNGNLWRNLKKHSLVRLHWKTFHTRPLALISIHSLSAWVVWFDPYLLSYVINKCDSASLLILLLFTTSVCHCIISSIYNYVIHSTCFIAIYKHILEDNWY